MPPSPSPSPSATDWDEAGALSIVAQGGLNEGNVVETALHCQHWRAVFPHAQIILAISVTDLFAAEVTPGVLRDPPLARAVAEKGQVRVAVARILASCDLVVLSEGALPLPQFKTIPTGPNNVNLQIAAAQAGLAIATGRHVLRVRSDLVFADRSFIAQYTAGNALPRSTAAVFAERLLISPFYTLNPFTYERMPLHYSDWFHFGRTEDVRALWDLPELPYADTIYFKTHKAAAGSQRDERAFVTRRAAEQYLVMPFFKRHFPDLTLDYVNDTTSIDLSVDILADNFIVCDLIAAHCVFDKYRYEFDNPWQRWHCVTPEDSAAMAVTTGAERRAVLESKRRLALHPETAPFPRHVPARGLQTKTGHHSQGEIIIVGRADGVLIHGPYDALPQGRYLATLHITAVTGDGSIDLAVTAGGGSEVLAVRRVSVEDGAVPSCTVPFNVVHPVVKLLELVATVQGVDALSVSGLTFARREDDPALGGVQLFSATAAPMHAKVGAVSQGSIQAGGKGGVLLHGPYISLSAGRHRVTLTIPRGTRPGWSTIEVLSDVGAHALAKRRIRRADLAAGRIACEFTATRDLDKVEVRVTIDRRADFAISEVAFEPL